MQNGYSALQGRARIHPPKPSDSELWRSVLDLSPDLAPAISFRDIKNTADRFAAMVAQGLMAETEAASILCGMVDGLAKRSRALKLLGNGVHPLVAANAWRTLSLAHNLRPLDLGA